ncbi:protein phosphatase 2C [Pelomyxa schiedti]|nr:protein phosphatase 2C [Pelomyxa schiedti]
MGGWCSTPAMADQPTASSSSVVGKPLLQPDGGETAHKGEQKAKDAELAELRASLSHSEVRVEQLRAEAETAGERIASLGRERDAALAELGQARSALGAMERERDAAISDLKKPCNGCSLYIQQRDRAIQGQSESEARLQRTNEDLAAALKKLEELQAQHTLLQLQIQQQAPAPQLSPKSTHSTNSHETTIPSLEIDASLLNGLVLPTFTQEATTETGSLNLPEISTLDLPDLGKLAESLDFHLPTNTASNDSSVVQFTVPSTETNSTLMHGIHCSENINLAGLKRQKKKPTYPSGKLEMEDMNFYEFPWQGNPDLAFIGVFDGFAGTGASKAAKAKLAPHLYTMITSGPPKSDYSETLTQCFLEVDQQLSEMEYEGCTCTVVIIWRHEGNRYLQAANIGDSSAYLCQAGISVPLTFDHKVSTPEENERLAKTAKDFEPHQTRIFGCVAVARALGTHFMKREGLGIIAEPYLSPPICLNPDHQFVIVASDGLWDVMTGQDVCDLLQGMSDPKEMASTVISTALRNPKCTDNITVAVGAL